MEVDEDGDLMFLGCAHPPTQVGDSLEEKMALQPNDFTKQSLAKIELQWIPMVLEHRPNQAFGVILKAYNTPNGSKYIKAVVTRDTPLGKWVAKEVQAGRFFLSLNHMSHEYHYPEKRAVIQTRTPVEVSVTTKPNRQGCIILKESIQFISRESWDPKQKWQIIKATQQEDSRTLPTPDLETGQTYAHTSAPFVDPLTSNPIPLMSSDSTMADAHSQAQAGVQAETTTMATSADATAAAATDGGAPAGTKPVDPKMDGVIPPPHVLKEIADGRGVQAEGMQQILRTLAREQLAQSDLKAQLDAAVNEKSEMAKRLELADNTARQQIMDNLMKIVRNQQQIKRAAQGDEAPAEEASAEAAQGDAAMEGGLPQEQVWKEFVGQLNPQQMMTFNRVAAIECANSTETTGLVNTLSAEVMRLRQQVLQATGKSDQVAGLLNQATTNSMGMATGSAASASARMPSGTTTASHEDSGRDKKRARSVLDETTYFDNLLDSAGQFN